MQSPQGVSNSWSGNMFSTRIVNETVRIQKSKTMISEINLFHIDIRYNPSSLQLFVYFILFSLRWGTHVGFISSPHDTHILFVLLYWACGYLYYTVCGELGLNELFLSVAFCVETTLLCVNFVHHAITILRETSDVRMSLCLL